MYACVVSSVAVHTEIAFVGKHLQYAKAAACTQDNMTVKMTLPPHERTDDQLRR